MKEIPKKISTLSAISMVVCGSIGSGIFFKNNEILLVNWDSLLFVIISWIFGSIGIISIVLVLGKISNNSKNSDLGLLEWNKEFNSNTIYLMCRNFIVYFYLPFVCFGMSFYFTISMQNAFGWYDAEWWEVFLVSISTIIFFSILSGFKSKNAKITNNILLWLKLLPILFVVGFSIYQMTEGRINDLTFINNSLESDTTNSLKYTRPFLAFSPITGIFASIPAIFFMFDGFYKVTTIQNDLKKPNDMSKIIIIGIVIMNIIYILLSIFLLLGFQDGSIGNIILDDPIAAKYITLISNVLVGISLLGCINANSIMSSKIFENVMNEGGLRVFNFIKNNNKINSLSKGNIAFNIIGLVFITISSIVGSLFFMNSSQYTFENENTNYLYSFIDIIIGWSSTMIFFMILLPVLGNLKNKRIKEKPITIISYLATIVIGFSLVFIVIENIGNLIIMINNDFYYNSKSPFYENNFNNITNAFEILNRNFVSTIIKINILFIFIIYFLSFFIFKKFRKKK